MGNESAACILVLIKLEQSEFDKKKKRVVKSMALILHGQKSN